MQTRRRFAIIAVITILPSLLGAQSARQYPQGMIAKPGLYERKQPDGTVFLGQLIGGPALHWMETEDGYTVRTNPETGFFEYVKPGADGKLQLTGLIVGRDKPAGLAKHARESDAAKKERMAEVGMPGPRRQPLAVKERYSSSGVINVLVIPAYFNNDDGTTATLVPTDIAAQFDDGDNASKTVRNYFLAVSYGKLDVMATVTDWVELPEDIDYYDEDFGNDPSELVKDAVDILFSQGFDFSPFDDNGDGLIGPVIVVHEGFGEEESGNRFDLWSHYSFTGQYDPFLNDYLPAYDVDTSSTSPGSVGLAVYDYIRIPELQMNWPPLVQQPTPEVFTIGVVCHEMGHGLALPDLYDTMFGGYVIGRWGLMDGGAWNNVVVQSTPFEVRSRPGDTPAELCAWSRMQLNWIEDPSLNNGMAVLVPVFDGELPPLETNPFAYQVPLDLWTWADTASSGVSTREYLLLENRQPQGFDEGLPNFGMLVYHIDDNKNFGLDSDNNILYQGDNRMVALVAADGRNDIENGDNAGDDSDPFPGFLDVRALGPYSEYDGVFFVPDTNHYVKFTNSDSTGDSNIWIENISNASSIPMTLDIRFLPNLQFTPETNIPLSPVRPPVTFRNGRTRDVYTPGDPFPFDLFVLNMDDNFPYAYFCEETVPYWIDFWASRVSGITRDEVTIARTRVDPGMLGNSYAEVEGTAPIFPMTDGSYSIAVHLDFGREVRESGELDNRWISPVTNVLLVNRNTGTDLAASNFTFGPQWTKEGDAIQLGGQVSNVGTEAAGPFWVEFWGSFDDPGKVYPTLDFMVCDSILVTGLAPGESIDLSTYNQTLYAIPDHEILQTFQIGCIVDRIDSVPESNDTNNFDFTGPIYFTAEEPPQESSPRSAEVAAEAPIAPVAIPDMSKTQLEQAELTVLYSTTTLSGQAPPMDLQVELVVQNWGTSPAVESWAQVIVSTDPIVSGDDYIWHPGIWVPPLGPGENISIAVPSAPPNLPIGLYHMLVQCDVLNMVPEDFENNNITYAGPLIVGPDLKIEYVNLDILNPGFYAPLGVEFAEPHARSDIRLRIVNNGIIKSDATWLEFFGSRFGGLTLDRFLFLSEVIPGMGPLSSTDLYYDKEMLSSPDSKYTFTAQVDRVGLVPEVFENNNRTPDYDGHLLHLRPVRPIDLWVPQFNMPNSHKAGTAIKFNGSVVNAGIEHSGPFWIEFWGTFDPSFPQPDFMLCDAIYIENLTPGEHYRIEPNQRVSYANLPLGEFTIICIVDRDDTVMENDETNNFRLDRFITIY